MNIYPFLTRKLGRTGANAAVIVARAILITVIVLLSDKGFTTFTYLQLNK